MKNRKMYLDNKKLKPVYYQKLMTEIETDQMRLRGFEETIIDQRPLWEVAKDELSSIPEEELSHAVPAQTAEEDLVERTMPYDEEDFDVYIAPQQTEIEEFDLSKEAAGIIDRVIKAYGLDHGRISLSLKTTDDEKRKTILKLVKTPKESVLDIQYINPSGVLATTFSVHSAISESGIRVVQDMDKDSGEQTELTLKPAALAVNKTLDGILPPQS